MAGTFAEQAALAADNNFINKCRCAIIFRAVELLTTNGTNEYIRQAMLNALRNGGADAALMAARLASGSATIAAAAPAVPSDADTQTAVNQFLSRL